MEAEFIEQILINVGIFIKLINIRLISIILFLFIYFI